MYLLKEINFLGRVKSLYDGDKLRALVNAVMNLRVPKISGNLSSGYTIGDLSSSTLVSYSYFSINGSVVVK
jgi:hypothetical protein